MRKRIEGVCYERAKERLGFKEKCKDTSLSFKE